jgi:hypothetical protein
MKKLIVMLMALSVLGFVFAGCSGGDGDAAPATNTPAAGTTEAAGE